MDITDFINITSFSYTLDIMHCVSKSALKIIVLHCAKCKYGNS